jgi:hypothetical protein
MAKLIEDENLKLEQKEEEKTDLKKNEKENSNELLGKALEQIEFLQKQLLLLQENHDLKKNNVDDSTIKIIHTQEMSDRMKTYIKISDVDWNLSKLGESRTLTKAQFEDLIGKYRHFFEKGILALDMKHSELAEQENLPCYDIKSGKFLTGNVLKQLPSMEMKQVEKIFAELSESGKKMFLSYWLNKCYNKENGFYDRYKMDTLNSISKTSIFDYMIKEIDSASEKLN